MPLDANIPLQFKPYQAPNLIEQQANIAMLQKAQAEADRFRTQQQQEQQMRDIMARNITTDEAGNTSLNRRGVLNELLKVAPAEALKIESDWRKADLDEQKGMLESRKAQIESAQKQLDYENQLLSSVVDQPSYENALQIYASNGGDISRFPARVDMGMIQQYQMMGLKQKERLDAQNQAILTAETLRKNRVDEEFKGAELESNRTKEQGTIIRQKEKDAKDDYIKLSDDYRTLTNQYNVIQTAKKNPAGVSDIALIMSYNKLLDPRSVVRENEFAMAAKAGGLPSQLQSYYNRMQGKGLVGDTARKELINQAEKIYEQASLQNEKLKSQFKERAAREGLDERNVLMDFSSSTTDAPAAKSISRSRLARVAKQAGKSLDEAIKAARDTGYTIEDK